MIVWFVCRVPVWEGAPLMRTVFATPCARLCVCVCLLCMCVEQVRWRWV